MDEIVVEDADIDSKPARLWQILAIVGGFLGGALIAMPAIMLALMSGGIGHGDYILARILFPATFLVSVMEGGHIGPIGIFLGLAQFPIYGALLGWASSDRRGIVAVTVAILHALAALACFTGILPAFD